MNGFKRAIYHHKKNSPNIRLIVGPNDWKYKRLNIISNKGYEIKRSVI